MNNSIIIQGARENNLKNISLTIPKNKLVVFTGPSGSGKSSMLIDTIFRESCRQYLEAIGLQGINKPKVDIIRNLSASISIDQKTNRNPRSTVGTVTDIYASMRMIYDKLGIRKCPQCHKEISHSLDLSTMEKEEHDESVTEYIICPHCHHRMERLGLSHFSYNTKAGACPACHGLGEVLTIQEDLVFHENLSIENGAVDLWEGRYAKYMIEVVNAAMSHFGIPLSKNLPLRDYSPEQRAVLYYGTESKETKDFFPHITSPKTVEEGRFEGVLPGMWRRLSEKSGQSSEADKYFHSECCPECHGERLNPLSREVKVGGKRIPELVMLSLDELDLWIENLNKSIDQRLFMGVDAFIKDIQTKIRRIIRTGLGYLSLDRQTVTLSGGETQRLKLAALLDSSLTGIMYVMDEPTIGLHPKDTMKIISVLKELRDMGNSVLVIEHDTGFMKEADHIIDFGPGAGKTGGQIVGQGSLEELRKQPESVTGRYLSLEETAKKDYRKGSGEPITIRHAKIHNLKDVTVALPAGCLIAITGVSGSGKSSLIFDVLAKGKDSNHEGFEDVSGLDRFERIVSVNQMPVSRMSRSNVATFIDAFTEIRKVLAKIPVAVQKGLEARHFSFNTPGGRCENCEGMGFVSTNMLFFPDLEVTCPVCQGQRFQPDVLEIKYQGSSINDILNYTVSESRMLFSKEKKIVDTLELLEDIGLGYLTLGQSLTTLSNGEGQRLKLAKELLQKSDKPALYLLDEPTTGLHPVDVGKLLNMLNILVDAGNTVIVVEHNTQLIRNVDYVVDLGPDGGEKGGRIVATGTPAEIAANSQSCTGRYL